MVKGSRLGVTAGWYRVRRHVHVGCLQEEVDVVCQEVDRQEGLDDACEQLDQGFGRQEFDGEGLDEGLDEGRRQRP